MELLILLVILTISGLGFLAVVNHLLPSPIEFVCLLLLAIALAGVATEATYNMFELNQVEIE